MPGATSLQKKHLKEVNDYLLPKFIKYEALRNNIAVEKDPLLLDSYREEGILLRNEIIEEFIFKMRDFLDSIIYSWNNHFQYAEAQSLVYEHVLEAAQRYKPSTTPFCKFTSFFWMYNQNIFKNKLIGKRAGKRDVFKTDSLDSLTDVSDREDNTKISYIKIAGIVEESTDKLVETNIVLRNLYDKASNKQKRILKRLYLGYSQRDIAHSLKITGTNVNNLIKQLRRNLNA